VFETYSYLSTRVISQVINTVNSQLFKLMKERRYTNKRKTRIILNILFGAFKELHKLLYLFFTIDNYFEK
jgi:predicted nucleotidyltransferase